MEGDPGEEDRGARWVPRVGKSGSVAEKEGVSGVLRVGGKGAWQGVGRACGDCLPGQPGEVVMGRRQGQGLLVEQLQGSVQKRETEAETGSDQP